MACFFRRVVGARWQLSLLGVCLLVQPAVQAESGDREVVSYFSSTYQETRDKFLKSARKVGARIESYRHSLSGPDGRPIYMDVALIGPKEAETVLILSSGTHGVEGFAGSAIQTGLFLQDITKRLPPGVRLMMLHAINPYGFAHLRRVNEDNVDLNRNFIDHTAPSPNPGYVALADVIEPNSLSFWENTKALIGLSWYLVKEGMLGLRRAISQGQYTHPQGLFYGGNAGTWSGMTVETIVKKHLSSAKKVMMVDYHTGLGEYAAAEVILNVPKESDAYKNAKACWGGIVKTTKEASASIDIRGSLKLAIPNMLPEAEVTAVSLEFGTFPVWDAFWAMRAENWLYHHADKKHAEWKRIKSDLLTSFYPQDESWKNTVWRKGKQVSEMALDCLRQDILK